MTYQIRNSNLSIILKNFKSEANAIKRLLTEDAAHNGRLTDEYPVFITENNGEITALIYCGVVYRPEVMP